jgi:ribosome-associated protein
MCPVFIERKLLRTQTLKKADAMPSPSDPDGRAVADQILRTVLASLDDSKAENTVSLDIQGKSLLADYMVITSGRSHRHVGAVADHLLRALKDAGFGAARVEGQASADWVLIDTGDVIVHIFRPEVRDFYALEKMWAEDNQAEADTLH